jgi:hypothetical protein
VTQILFDMFQSRSQCKRHQLVLTSPATGESLLHLRLGSLQQPACGRTMMKHHLSPPRHLDKRVDITPERLQTHHTRYIPRHPLVLAGPSPELQQVHWSASARVQSTGSDTGGCMHMGLQECMDWLALTDREQGLQYLPPQ